MARSSHRRSPPASHVVARREEEEVEEDGDEDDQRRVPKPTHIFRVDGKRIRFCIHHRNSPGQQELMKDHIIRRGGSIVDEDALDEDNPCDVFIVPSDRLEICRPQWALSDNEWKHDVFVEDPAWLMKVIRRGTYFHSTGEKTGMPGPIPGARYEGRPRVEFTPDDEEHLCKVIAQQIPQKEWGGRQAPSLYKLIVSLYDPDLDPDDPDSYSWVRRHTWQSWKEHYKKNMRRLDAEIDYYARSIVQTQPRKVAEFPKQRKAVRLQWSSDEDEEGGEFLAHSPDEPVRKRARPSSTAYDDDEESPVKRPRRVTDVEAGRRRVLSQGSANTYKGRESRGRSEPRVDALSPGALDLEPDPNLAWGADENIDEFALPGPTKQRHRVSSSFDVDLPLEDEAVQTRERMPPPTFNPSQSTLVPTQPTQVSRARIPPGHPLREAAKGKVKGKAAPAVFPLGSPATQRVPEPEPQQPVFAQAKPKPKPRPVAKAPAAVETAPYRNTRARTRSASADPQPPSQRTAQSQAKSKARKQAHTLAHVEEEQGVGTLEDEAAVAAQLAADDSQTHTQLSDDDAQTHRRFAGTETPARAKRHTATGLVYTPLSGPARERGQNRGTTQSPRRTSAVMSHTSTGSEHFPADGTRARVERKLRVQAEKRAVYRPPAGTRAAGVSRGAGRR